MPVKIFEPKPPGGLARLGFRLPIQLYRLGLSGLLGTRFVCLTHTGRKSGKPRQTVLEVVRYDKATGACIVASGFGKGSDWLLNVEHDLRILFTIGRTQRTGLAVRLDPEMAGRELAEYACRYPLAWRELVQFMGYKVNGTENDILALGNMIPLYRFQPNG